MPRCKGAIFGFAGGPSQSCALAGLRDKGSGELLCAEHARRGEVTNAEAGALVSKALGRATPLPPGRSRWSLWNSLGAEKDRLGELTDGDKALVIKACEVELRRKCTEPPGNLTRCHVALNGLLTAADLEMLAPPAPVVAEREATRAELDTEALRCGWPVLGHAARGVYPTAALSTMDLNLAEFGPAAAQPLEQQQQRRRPATSLAEVLEELEIRAGELTESNDFIKGFALGDRLQRDVVLIDDRAKHFIVLHYDPASRELNYLERPASSLRLEERPGDPSSEADLVALLRLIFAQQDYNNVVPRSSKVVVGFMIRDDQVVLHESFKMHPELFPAPKPGEPAPTDCTLATYRRVRTGGGTAPGSEPATDSRLSKNEVSELRSILANEVERKHAAARGTNHWHFWLAAQIDHSIPCWLVTFLLMQFFGTRSLGGLSPADRLWLYKEVKSLHNGSKNAMMVSEVRNQYHVWLSVLLAT